jgi:hypothetical protein
MVALGHRFMDNFDDGLLPGWGTFGYDPPFESVTIEEAEGRLRVSGDCATCDRRGVILYRNEIVTTNVAASIDILHWDESGGNLQSIGLVARLAPGPVGYGSDCYVAGVSPLASDDPGQSVLWIMRYEDEDNRPMEQHTFSKMQTSDDYRLVFYMVGNKGTVELHNLSNPELQPEIFTAVDNTGQPFAGGGVGFLLEENSGPGGRLDVTVDHFVIAGTSQ